MASDKVTDASIATNGKGLRGKLNKVVLAYSGGLDTSVIVPWLRFNYLSSYSVSYLAINLYIFLYLYITTCFFNVSEGIKLAFNVAGRTMAVRLCALLQMLVK